MIGRRGVDDDELGVAGALDVVDGLPLLHRELHLDLEEAGRELADEEDDEAEVDDPEPELAHGELEALRLRGDEIGGEHQADETPSREDGDGPRGARNGPQQACGS